MNEITIVGSGFSALASYLSLEKDKPEILSCSNINLNNKDLINRKNLETNKFFSVKTSSVGSLNFNLKSNYNIHDRISLGGNSNIWGGFININNLPKKFINIFNQNSIKFERLDFKTNGYNSNNDSIRQLRDSKNNILDTKTFYNDFINGYLFSFKVHKNKIQLKFLNEDSKNFNFLETKKLVLAISFPQLLDLLFRSGFIQDNNIISLSEFEHKFVKSLSQSFHKYKNDDCVIKYDFLRSLKHYLGYQKSLDKLRIAIPFYID